MQAKYQAGERFRSSDARRQPARIEKDSRGSPSHRHKTTHNNKMAIERWFYHKFHHGLTLADVERYTHLLVGIQFFIVLAAAITAPLYWLATKPWLRAALLRGDYSDELDDQGRPGANWRPLPPKQKGSKRRKHDYPSFCWDAR